jgi:hypothetical protein
MTCKGLHCNGCSGGGRGAAVVLIVLVLVVMIGKAVSKTVQHAWHVLAVVLEVVMLIVAGAAAIGVLLVIGWAGIRLHRWLTSQVRKRELAKPLTVEVISLPAKTQEIESPYLQLPSGITGIDLDRVRRPSPPSN